MRLPAKWRWLKSKWGVLLLMQAVLMMGILYWGVQTLQQTRREVERYAMPQQCPQGHQPLVIVDLVYSDILREDELAERDRLNLQTRGEGYAGLDSPAFLFRCPQCGWEQDGWDIMTVIQLKGEGRLPDLPGMTE